MGAKPVPEAIKIKGFWLLGCKKKLPNGPSTRRMSFSFIPPNTWSVNTPPGMWRMCSSMPGLSAWVCGALAMEYARRVPSRNKNSMYCPAKYTNFSVAGSCSCTCMTSGLKRARLRTRTGIFLMGGKPSKLTWRDSSTTSLWAVARQVKITSWRASSSLKAWAEWLPCVVLPLNFWHLHEPQAPSLQP